MFDPVYAGALETARAIQDRVISCAELTEIHLNRIPEKDGPINSVVLTFPEPAMERAREADAALERNQVWGPLHGVPVTIKENFAMAGVPTTIGLEFMRDFRPPRNATAVDKLLEAGAIAIGKTNVPVMVSDWQSFNEVYGLGIEDMLHRIPATAKIRAAIGWQPELELERILRDAVDYAKSGSRLVESDI